MFTKTLSALAIILSTASSAVAVTKHEGTAANHEPAIKASRQNPRDKADFVIGNMLFVGFHEMGHALADQFHLPTLGRAEDMADTVAPLRMAAFGASFHWTDRIAVARHLDRLVEPNWAIVILSPTSLWTGRVFEWKAVVIDTIKHWLGDERRAGPGTFPSGPMHQECLKQTPFCALTEARFVQPHVWKYDGIIGYLYSTSFASRAVLGDKAANFEKDLRERLLGLSPDGLFTDEIEYSVISACRE